jgi:hypothetical protein
MVPHQTLSIQAETVFAFYDILNSEIRNRKLGLGLTVMARGQPYFTFFSAIRES